MVIYDLRKNNWTGISGAAIGSTGELPCIRLRDYMMYTSVVSNGRWYSVCFVGVVRILLAQCFVCLFIVRQNRNFLRRCSKSVGRTCHVQKIVTKSSNMKEKSKGKISNSKSQGLRDRANVKISGQKRAEISVYDMN
jgi:hypothetical protein